MISVTHARAAIARAAEPLVAETVAINQACGRILADAVISPMDLPPFSNSAMDGYALCLADLQVLNHLPVVGVSFAGSAPSQLLPKTAMRIFTGAPLPVGADTVVIQEDVQIVDEQLQLNAGQSYRVGDNIRGQGHELAKGSVWFDRGRKLSAADCGLLAAMGLADVQVIRRPKIALLASGDELITPGLPLEPGQIYNSNHTLLLGILDTLGCDVVYSQTVVDDLPATEQALAQAAQYADVILCTGGVSVGDADFVKTALESLGELQFWKIAVKPGKPLAFGRINKAAFFGLPGNPVSAYVTFMLFVWPYLQALQENKQLGELQLLPVKALFDWPTAGKREEFLRVTTTRIDGQLAVELLPNQSSGSLSSVALADGFVRVPVGKTWQAGDTVEFLVRPF